MKSTPITFNGEEVRAILAGKKTQTRRIVKQQPVCGDYIVKDAVGFSVGQMRDSENAWREIECPYGKAGNKLWVRETWAEIGDQLGWDAPNGKQPDGYGAIAYRADGEVRQHGVMLKEPESWQWDKPTKWKPSIHMPRWASRITLEITGIRAERVQDISETDCEIELGVEPYSLGNDAYPKFKELWQKINGKDSWNANPWVWAISFKKI